MPLKISADRTVAFAEQPQAIDQFDDLRFLFVDCRITVLSSVISKETGIWGGVFSVREPLPLTPCNIFRDAAAFLLCKATHKCD